MMADVHWQSGELDKLMGEVNDFVDTELLPDIAKDMRRMVPVDTGNLRDGIEVLGNGRIGISADNEQGQSYVEFVEFGTEVMAAQPFIRPALYRKRG